MTQITLRDGDERRTVDADFHHGYLVIPGTKIPILNEKLLAGLAREPRERITAKIAAARKDDTLIPALWQEGEVLRFALEQPHEKFVYIDFLQKFQDRNFWQRPLDDALSAVERQYILASVDLAIFKDQPAIVMSLLRSLPAERMANLLHSNADKIARFILHFGTPGDMREFLALIPKKQHHRIIHDNNCALLLEAMSDHKREMIDVLLECLSEGMQGVVVLKELQLKVLRSTIGDRFHPNFHENVFLAILPVTLAACKVEGNTGAVEHAYKLAVLFSESGAALKYLKKWTDPKRINNSHQPVHDALLFTLPQTNEKYDSTAWSKLATEQGPVALEYFGNAEEIEHALAKLNKIATESNHPTIDLAHARPKDLQKAASMLEYRRSGEHPEWANLCASFGVSQHVFEKGLSILKHVKTEDKTPDIGIINGADIGKPGYYMRKLAPADPKALLIGKMVQCCNHIDDGHTEDMAIAQVASPDAACYVMFKEEQKGKQDAELDKPIAKVTGWMSTRNNLVFNSWERLSDDYTHLCEPFLSEAARRVFVNDPAIGRVLLGKNRDEIESFTAVADPETARSPDTSSSDSDAQYLIAAHTRSPEIEQRIKEQSGEPQISLWEAIIKETSNLDLSPTQIHRLQKKLRKIRAQIDEIESIALESRQEARTDGDSYAAKNRFSHAVDRPMQKIDDFMGKELYTLSRAFQGTREATAFICNVAIKHILSDLGRPESDFKPYGYGCDFEKSKDSIALLGGHRSIKEYVFDEPRKFAFGTGLSLALLAGAGLGMRHLEHNFQENQVRENAAIKLEQDHPGIFRAVCDLKWTERFKDVDISDVEAVRAKFGNTITLGAIEMPVEEFVEKVAPALNTLEEIRKQTPPAKWNIQPASNHQQRIEQAQTEQKKGR